MESPLQLVRFTSHEAIFLNSRGWKSSETIFSRRRYRFINHANGFILGLIEFRMLMWLGHTHIGRTRRSDISKNLFISTLGGLVVSLDNSRD